MIKIGFRSFIYGMVKRASSSLFEEWKSDEEEKASKEQRASFLASGVTAFGNVGGSIKSLGFDPFATYREAIGRGQGRLMFQVQRMFTPLLNEIRWNSNILNLTTGDVFLRNSEGLAIGQAIGTAIQGLATAIYPPLFPLWMVFPWLGGMLGAGIQGGFGVSSQDPTIQELISGDYEPNIDPNAAVDIFVEPAPSPARFVPRTPVPKEYSGRLRKLWMLEFTDDAHWL